VAAQEHHLHKSDRVEKVVGIFERANSRGNESGEALVREKP
jgi:hypothetical protein